MKGRRKVPAGRRAMAFLAALLLFVQNGILGFGKSNEQAGSAESVREALYEMNVKRDFSSEGENPFGLKTLIIKTDLEDFDILGAERKLAFGDGIYALYYPDTESTKAAFQKYQEMEGIHFAEADVPVKLQEEKESLDVKIFIPAGKDLTKEGRIEEGRGEDGVVSIALLDTGADTENTEISPYLQGGGINVSGSGKIESTADDNGHGTTMAQMLVSAVKERGRDENTVKILPVKALNKDGEGTILGIYLSMKNALEEGADFITLSVLEEMNSLLLKTIVKEGEKVRPKHRLEERTEAVEEEAGEEAVEEERQKTGQGEEFVTDTCIRGLDHSGRYYNPAEVYSDVEIPKHHIVFNLMCDNNAQRTSTATEKTMPLYTRFYVSCGNNDLSSDSLYKMIQAFYRGERAGNSEDFCFIDEKAHVWEVSDHIDEKTAFCTSPFSKNWLKPSKRGYKDGRFMVGNAPGAEQPFRDVGGGDSLSGWGMGPISQEIYFRASYGYDIHYYTRNTKDSSDYITKSVEDDLNGTDVISDPEKKGYVFRGWTLDQHGTEPDKVNGKVLKRGVHIYSIRPSSASDTKRYRNLYAVWKPRTAAVKYNANGGSGRISDTVFTYDRKGTLSGGSGFSRTGHVLKGWNTKPDGSGKSYGLGEDLTNPRFYRNSGGTSPQINWNQGSQSAVLYAVWEPVRYYVRYHGNGAVSGSMGDSVHTYDKETQLSTNRYKRQFKVSFNKNHTDDKTVIRDEKATAVFKGWMKSGTGTKADYADKASVKNLAGTQGAVINLYAKWEDGKITLPNPKREGYDLLGWSTDPNAGKEDKGYKPGAEITVSSEKTLYAVWKPITYRMRYDANGGTGSMADGVKTYGKPYTVKKNAFLRTGYDFAGWNTKPDGSGASYEEGKPYQKNAPVTFYALWRENYVVAYIGNEQTGGTDFLDKGEDGTGNSENLDYVFDENKEAGNADAEHFEKEETETAYTDEETGEQVKQKISSTVVGWSTDEDMVPNQMEGSESTYDFGENVAGSKLMKEAGNYNAITLGAPKPVFGTYPKNSITAAASASVRGAGTQPAVLAADPKTLYGGVPYINLFAVWDKGPVIEAYDRYYTLEEAQGGFITEEELLNVARAEDEEAKSPDNPKGRLKNFEDEEQKTSFTVWDYREEEFTELKSTAVISVTYRAEDSAGNITRKMVLIHIVDSHSTVIDGEDIGADPDPGKVRFISEKYLDTLDKNSIWRHNPEYRAVLEDAVSYKRVNPKKSEPVPVFGDRFSVDVPGTGEWNKEPQSVWTFTRAQVKEAQEFVRVHGPSNYKEADGLQKFYEQFRSCRKTP